MINSNMDVLKLLAPLWAPPKPARINSNMDVLKRFNSTIKNSKTRRLIVTWMY